MIISFDGLDGVGKTTISKEFAKQHNFKYISRPLYQVFGILDKNSDNYQVAKYVENNIYNESNSYELKAFLTSLGLMYLHKVVDNDEFIVLDRGLLSNYSFNGTEESNPLFEAMLKMGIYADITFLLYASMDTRIQRIKKRNPLDSDLSDKSIINQKYEKLWSFINDNNLSVIIIDTENKSLEEVLDEVNKKYKEVMINGNIKSRRKSRFDK